MSYTAPQYVDTKEQAILALASTIADTDKTLLGDGSVNKALDILADCLAEHDVSVPQTDAGAILALAQYVGGGGGGGSTEYAIECYDDTGAKVPSYVYAATVVHEDDSYLLSVDTSAAIDSAEAGTFVVADPDAVTGDDWYLFINVKQSDMENPSFLEYPQHLYYGSLESPDDDPKQWVGCIMTGQKLFVYTASWQ